MSLLSEHIVVLQHTWSHELKKNKYIQNILTHFIFLLIEESC